MMAHCMICNDLNDFRMQKQNTRNILMRLERFVDNEALDIYSVKDDNIYYEIFNKMVYANKNPHFMCGVCYKVNLNELTMMESKIKDIITRVVILSFKGNLFDDKKKVVKRNLLEIVGGEYPILYNIIEEEYLKSIR